MKVLMMDVDGGLVQDARRMACRYSRFWGAILACRRNVFRRNSSSHTGAKSSSGGNPRYHDPNRSYPKFHHISAPKRSPPIGSKTIPVSTILFSTP